MKKIDTHNVHVVTVITGTVLNYSRCTSPDTDLSGRVKVLTFRLHVKPSFHIITHVHDRQRLSAIIWKHFSAIGRS